MKNKNVGILIIGIAVIVGVLIFLFNNAMTNIVSVSCTHGPSCTMYDTIETQTYISIVVAGLILIIGLFFTFSKESEKLVFKTRLVKQKRKPVDTSKMDANEKKVVKILQEENGAIFQSTLMEKLEVGKVGMTRVLDKLEAKQVIERKRRGMNNIVVLK